MLVCLEVSCLQVSDDELLPLDANFSLSLNQLLLCYLLFLRLGLNLTDGLPRQVVSVVS